ncbi:MAG: 2-dehydropantoate 2-reductase [Deltaproteobacteria bacterium]|nr:2-dehydropantoate 2-reductase [Deltaproteobacteria bacterium]
MRGLFEGAGFKVETADDPKTLIWEKLIINAGINAISAVLHVPNGAVLEYDDARALLSDIVREAVTVARADGLPFEEDIMIERVAGVARSTAPNRSSMLADLEHGRRTEIDYIHGAIVREGERLGVETPLCRVMTRLVRALERRGGDL